MKKIFIASLLALTSALNLKAQQLKIPAASPLATIKQAFALSDITIEYSRPGVKNRVIFGDLVPYNKIWRTGANQSTKITFGDDVMVSGQPVAAGTYALYSMPGKDSWDMMLYKDITLGGNVADYKPENEIMRFKAVPAATTEKTETFTIELADVNPKSLAIVLLWDKTKIAFPVTADFDSKVMKNIETSLEKDTRPYYQAASYYYDNDKDLKQALTWVNLAIEQNPKGFFIYHTKAKIQLKMNDKAGAIETAEKSIALAREQKNDDFVRLNEKLIADAKKK